MSSGIDYHGTTPTNKLEYLAPGFRDAVNDAIKECNARDLDAIVYETYRSNELQALYYSRGRTVKPPDKPVTNAMTNLYSWHGYGLAVDVISKKDRWNKRKDWFEAVAEVFLARGCKWGGHWTSVDLPHFQWGLCRASPSDKAREIMHTQGVSAVWQAVGALSPQPARAAEPSTAASSPPPLSGITKPMATSVYKGAIGTGSITAAFKSDSANADSDLLVISYLASGGANPQIDQKAVAPGGSARASVQADRSGLLEVWVAIGAETDRGRLTVLRNGSNVDDEDIQGSVRWVYSVG